MTSAWLDEVQTPARDGNGKVATHPSPDGEAAVPSERVAVVASVSLASVAKMALAFWSAIGVFIMCASGVVYGVLNLLGIVGNVERFAADLTTDKHFHLVSGQLILFLLLVTVMFVLIATALTVIGAAFYNLLSAMLGGVRIATRERVVPGVGDHLSPGRFQA